MSGKPSVVSNGAPLLQCFITTFCSGMMFYLLLIVIDPQSFWCADDSADRYFLAQRSNIPSLGFPFYSMLDKSAMQIFENRQVVCGLFVRRLTQPTSICM